MTILCALITRGTHVLAEYDQSDAPDDLCELGREAIPSITKSTNNRQYVMRGYAFNHVIHDDMTFISITDKDLKDGNQIAFNFLRSLKVRINRNSDKTSTGLTEILRLELASYPKGTATKIGKVEQELHDVANLMKENIEQVMERGEAIEGLMDKTTLLKNEAKGFRSAATRHANAQYWQQIRSRAAIVLVFLAFLTVLMYLSCGTGLCLISK